MYIKKPVMKSAGVIIASFQSSTMPRISTSGTAKRRKRMALGCNRTKRRESRRSEKNERIYRGEKVSKGRIVLRTKRAVIRPGDIVYVGKKKYIVASSKNLGKQLKLADGSLLTTSKVTKIIHCGGWKTVTM